MEDDYYDGLVEQLIEDSGKENVLDYIEKHILESSNKNNNDPILEKFYTKWYDTAAPTSISTRIFTENDVVTNNVDNINSKMSQLEEKLFRFQYAADLLLCENEELKRKYKKLEADMRITAEENFKLKQENAKLKMHMPAYELDDEFIELDLEE
jgi:FtsZ-binding cell division protein ZapB